MFKVFLISVFGLIGCTCYVDETIDNDMSNPIPVRIVPGQTGWSQSGNLITFTQSGVSLQAIFSEPDVYTIQFGITPPPSPLAFGAIIRPQAQVSWNVKGNQIVRTFDVSNGSSISGRAESVNVRLTDSLIAPMVGTPGIPYVGSIQVAKGVRPTNQIPIFSPINIENPLGTAVVNNGSIVLAAASSALFVVPEGASQVYIAARYTPALVNPDLAAVLQNATAITQAWNITPYSPEWEPVPPSSTRLVVANSEAVACRLTVLFGIEG